MASSTYTQYILRSIQLVAMLTLSQVSRLWKRFKNVYKSFKGTSNDSNG